MKHLPKIHFETIKHNKHRYETVGDYYFKNGTEQFRVSKMNDDYEFLVFLHEFMEWYLTKKRGIKEKNITKFDIQFEKNRKEGNEDEPGDDKNAPYYYEHQFATKIEKLAAKELKVDWKKYNDTINNL